MQVIIIAAMAANRVIGKEQAMPWHLPAEQLHFKETTWGAPVIMGRKTFESIGRPLPGRRNIVISGDEKFAARGCELAPDLKAALALCTGAKQAFVVGGEQIFTQALPLADTIILTTLAREVEGDAFFPVFEQDFDRIDRKEIRTDPEPYVIEVYRRKAAGPRPGS